MAVNLYLVRADGTNPYENLALESCLTEEVPGGSVVLYLWQNRRTVVIGKNQNAWAECRVELLEEDGGFVARRPSGGGAVFHDMGNLNFSFIAQSGSYNLTRQLEVIRHAAALLGIPAKWSGRNDILADGRKFSGNAFLSKGDNHCHHGTIMVDVSTRQLEKYLSVSKLKLESKGVKSVKSRVVNLVELQPDITVPRVESAMAAAFGEVYGESPRPLPQGIPDNVRLGELTELYSSWGWVFGRRIPFSAKLQQRFDWGLLTLELQAQSGVIRDALCYCDALDTGATDGLAECLVGVRYDNETMSRAVGELAELSPGRSAQFAEIAAWLSRNAGQSVIGGQQDEG